MAESRAKVLIVLAAVVCLLTWWPREATGEEKNAGVTLRLVRVEETRRTEFVSKKAKPCGFKKPGLELIYDITLPDGLQLLDIEQPEKITASDSRRHDLTDVEKNFMGVRKYVDFLRSSNRESEEFTLQLALPKRQAKHFSVSTTFDVWGYRELTESVVTVKVEKAVTLDAALFGGTKVTAVLKSAGIQTQLKLTPGTIRRFVEGVTLSDGTNECRINGSVGNDASITYFFNTKAADTMAATFTIRSGLRRMPCTVALEHEPLP